MKKSHLLILFLSLLSCISIAQTADITLGCSPLEVQFTAPTGTSSFFWNFQNGVTSTLPNPVTTFASSGTYAVEFRAAPDSSILGTITVTVFDKPELEIATDTTQGCSPLLVQFEDLTNYATGLEVSNYNWVFGDGGSAEETNSPSYTYTTAGTFTVSLAVQTNLETCNTTTLFHDLIAVTSPAFVNFSTSPDPPVACAPPLTVAFDNLTFGGGNLSYEWDFGNGNGFIGETPPEQVYTEEGSFPVRLTVMDENECTAIMEKQVVIRAPRADFIVPDSVCLGDSIMLQNESEEGTYFWQFGTGLSPAFSQDTMPSVLFVEPGDQNIKLTVTRADGCIGDTTINVFVDFIEADIISDPNYSCSDPLTINYSPLPEGNFNYIWVIVDSIFSSEENPSYTYINEDTTTYSINGIKFIETILFVFNSNGCRDTTVQIDRVHLPNALFHPNTIDGCAPLTVDFEDLSTSNEVIIRSEWDFGDGTTEIYSEPTNTSHTFTEPGEYQVQLNILNAGDCVDTSYQITILVGDTVAIDFEADQTQVCPGDTVQFIPTVEDPTIEAWHFETEGGRSFHCFQDPNLAWTYENETGPQDVSLTVEYNGCLSTITKEDYINVSGPIARLDYAIDCARPFDVSFRDSSLDATTIFWEFGDTTTSTFSDLIHIYDTTGDYTVILTAENIDSGCAPSRDTAIICIRNVEANFEMAEFYCKDFTYDLVATASIDVDTSCWKGYNWYFEHSSRPITTPLDTVRGFIFPQSGPEIITLITEDVNGCKDTLSQSITIYGVDVDFEVDKTAICNPSEVNFTDLSQADTTIAAWSWNFGDANASNVQNPSHIYSGFDPTITDTIHINLTITDTLGCSSFDTLSISTFELQTLIVSDPVVPAICVGIPINFATIDQGYNNSWTFGNNQEAEGQVVSTIYDQAGSYFVQLISEDPTSGCVAEEAVTVQVQDYPIADFISSVDNTPIICYPQNIQFFETTQSTGITSYNWSFGNGQQAQGPTPFASFDKGTFNIELIASSSFGCRDTISKSITLVGPEGDFAFAPDAICLGEDIDFFLIDTVDVSSFTWNFGDGTEADNITPINHEYTFLPPTGQTLATLILRGENEACSFAIEKPIEIGQVIANFISNNGIDTILCTGPYPFTNNSEGADLFSWDFGNGAFSTEENPSTNYEAEGLYTVQLIVEDSQLGCLDTFTQALQIAALEAPALLDLIICEGDTAVLSVINPDSSANYFWTPSDLVSAPFSMMPTTAPEFSTTYTVKVTDTFGCEAENSLNLEVLSPLDEFSFDTIALIGSNLSLNSPYTASYFNYTWSPSQTLSCTDCPAPSFEAMEDITYTLLIEDTIGCTSTEIVFNIDVIEEILAIPNAFTPDNDGDNDYFNIITEFEDYSEFLDIQVFEVYNRWGQKVYENGDPLQGWNGIHNGKPAPSDAYLYRIIVNWALSGRQEELKGDFVLIR